MEIRDKQREMIREIIGEEARKGEWLPVPEAFHSGDMIGFDVAGVCVRAEVDFDRFGVVVRMVSPVDCSGSKDIYCRQPTFFHRNPAGASLFEGGVEGGPATQKCISVAKDVLIGLYTDWMVLMSSREEIRGKVSGFPEWAESFVKKEKERIAPDRRKLLDLSARSGQLKKLFKSGGMSQADYVKARQPIHEEIVSLMARTSVRDPFACRFSEELGECLFVRDRRSFIENL